MEASHRISQNSSSAGRLRARHRCRIVQALFKFGCGDLSIRQHSFPKDRDSGMAPRATVALQPCWEAFSWRPSVPMHLSHPRTTTTSWRQSADISLSNLHARKQPNGSVAFRAKVCGVSRKTIRSKSGSAGQNERFSAPLRLSFLLPRRFKFARSASHFLRKLFHQFRS